MNTATWTAAQPWGGHSGYVELDGGDVHWIDYGGPPGAPRIVLVHGLGGSHLNWVQLAPLLTAEHRVSAVDLAGFGLTHSRGRSSTVTANADLLERFVDDGDTPVTLVGNSMGGLISAIVAQRRPSLVRRLVLLDPAFPLVLGARPDPLVLAAFGSYAVPRLGERVMARRRATATPARLVQETLDLCCAHPERVPAEVVAASEALVRERAAEPGLDAAFLEAARSLLRFNASPKRAWRTYAGISVPVLLVHGERDRLVPVHAARAAARRNPAWRLEVLPDVGHVPQIEVPERTADLVLGFLG